MTHPRPIGRRRLLTLALLLSCAYAAAGQAATGEAAAQGALEALHQSLRSDRPTYTRAVLDQLYVQLEADGEAVRPLLLAAMDSLEQSADRGAEAWQQLLAKGGQHGGRRSVERFLRELLHLGRLAVEGDDNYVLQASIAYAARRSGLPEEQARAFLGSIVAEAYGRGQLAVDGQLGLVVTGRTATHGRDMEALYLFFGSRDEEVVTEKVREVHRFVVPRVVARLPRAESVKWAVRGRDLTPLLDPDLHLAVEVTQLRFEGVEGQAVPCLELEMELSRRGSGVAGQRLPLTVCDTEPAAAHSLASLWELVARAVCEATVELLPAYAAGGGR